MAQKHQPRQILDNRFLSSLATLDLCVKSVRGGQLGGSRQSQSHGSSIEWMDYREYIPGDDLRRLDWNLVGRFDKYYIKRFVDERQLETHVYIDLSASMDWQDNGQKGVMALRLAAALGYLSISNMDRLSYRLLSGAGCRELCPSLLDKDAFLHAALELSELTFSGQTDLYAAITNDSNPGSGNGISFIISDLLTDSDWKKAVDWLLEHHREVAVIQVLSRQEADPFCSGSLNFLDCEKEIEEQDKSVHMDVDRSALEAYRMAFADWQQDMRDFCRKRGVGFLTVCSDERIEDIILKKGMAAGVIR